LKAKRYEEANLVKRKLVSLKRNIIKESSAESESSQAAALDSIQQIQDRMKTMMELVKTMDKSTSCILNSEKATVTKQREEATFHLSETCTLKISTCSGSFLNEFNGGIKSALVIWTNEAFDLSMNETGRNLLAVGGKNLIFKICEIETLASTDWGPAKCITGDSVLLNGPLGQFDGLKTPRCIILAVPPLNEDVSTKEQWDGEGGENKLMKPKTTNLPGKDSLHYMVTGLRTALKSSLRKINYMAVSGVEVEVVGVSTATSLDYQMYDAEGMVDNQDKSLQVTLKTILDEIMRVDNKLKMVHLFASSGSEECNQLIQMALEMGLREKEVKVMH